MESRSAEPVLYDYVKMKFKVDPNARPSEYPSVIWKDQKKQWLVLCFHVIPQYCYITYCQQEDVWLSNRKTLPKISLNHFGLQRSDAKSKIQMIELYFTAFSLVLEFDSVSKLQMWFDLLQRMKNRIYCDLVRCPEKPQNEKEYVLEMTEDGAKFYDPSCSNGSRPPLFEWKISFVKRAKCYTNTGKIEIEVGRKADSGAGRYFFIGQNIGKFYNHIKALIEQGRRDITNRHKQQQTITDAKSRSLSMLPSSTDTPTRQINTISNASDDVPPPLPSRTYISEDDKYGKDEEIFYHNVQENDTLFLSSSSMPLQRKSSEPCPPPLPPRITDTRSKSLSVMSQGQDSYEFPDIQDSLNPYQSLEPKSFVLSHHYDRTNSTSDSNGPQIVYSLAGNDENKEFEEFYDLPILPPRPHKS